MNTDYYKIKIDDIEIATHITLEYVCIFLKAIFNEFFNEDTLSVTVERYEEKENDGKRRESEHGEWINKRTMQHDGEFYCSVCDFVLDSFMQGVFYNYCHHCGADMRGERKDEK